MTIEELRMAAALMKDYADDLTPRNAQLAALYTIAWSVLLAATEISERLEHLDDDICEGISHP